MDTRIDHSMGTAGRVNTYARNVSDARPWGSWETLDVGPGFTVKRITVKPGHRLSLQRHAHRGEHWVVVAGTARVTRDHEIMDVQERGTIHLPLGCVHRLENPGSKDLIVIEVQVGDILDESDIVRIEDGYGRA
jgi:mannose-1-phosphate guanylyltransferase/mannose-6-phosphate isomerase